jgi:hypothetical protein
MQFKEKKLLILFLKKLKNISNKYIMHTRILIKLYNVFIYLKK